MIGRQQANFEYSQKIYADSLELVRKEEIKVLKSKQREEQRIIVVVFSVVLTVVLLLLKHAVSTSILLLVLHLLKILIRIFYLIYIHTE